MADQPKAAPARVAVSGQDVLLATKLHVPGLQPGFVPRPRLAEALGEGLARQLILVCAPAGFGKTAVLAAWARRWRCDELGQVQRAQGRLDAAVRTCQQALEITAPHGRPPLPAAGPAYVGLGEVAYERMSSTVPPACHRGHRAMPTVRLHPAAGRGPGNAGVDPAGHR